MAELRHFARKTPDLRPFVPQQCACAPDQGTAKSAPALIARRDLNKGLENVCDWYVRPARKGFAISAYADIRHEQLFFERQQSLTLRKMEWEGRVEPLLSWSTLIVRGAGIAILAMILAFIV